MWFVILSFVILALFSIFLSSEMSRDNAWHQITKRSTSREWKNKFLDMEETRYVISRLMGRDGNLLYEDVNKALLFAGFKNGYIPPELMDVWGGKSMYAAELLELSKVGKIHPGFWRCGWQTVPADYEKYQSLWVAELYIMKLVNDRMSVAGAGEMRFVPRDEFLRNEVMARKKSLYVRNMDYSHPVRGRFFYDTDDVILFME